MLTLRVRVCLPQYIAGGAVLISRMLFITQVCLRTIIVTRISRAASTITGRWACIAQPTRRVHLAPVTARGKLRHTALIMPEAPHLRLQVSHVAIHVTTHQRARKMLQLRALIHHAAATLLSARTGIILSMALAALLVAAKALIHQAPIEHLPQAATPFAVTVRWPRPTVPWLMCWPMRAAR